MPWSQALRHALSPPGLVRLAAAGVLGNLVVNGARRMLPDNAGRTVVVRAVAGGMVLGRRLEEWAEEARLRAGDVVAEARATLGQDQPPPAVPGEGTHQH